MLATPFAVIAGITYNYMPFAALPIYVALARIDRRLVEAARTCTRATAILPKVVLPLSMPGHLRGGDPDLRPGDGDYVNSAVLGGPGTTMIGQIIQDFFLVRHEYTIAAAMSVILMLGMLVLALAYARVLGTEDSTLAAGAAA